MPTPDLPAELWLEILSYLHLRDVYKLIGVNRTFFNLAMRDKYEEIELIADDKKMFRTLEQLHCHSVAAIVRKLHLRPAFLPGIGESADVEAGTSFSRLKQFLNKQRGVVKHHSTAVTAQKLFSAATASLPKCTNLSEITIIIYDHLITPAFQKFLHELWQNMGDGIQKLTISTTLSKIPIILKSVMESAPKLRNLESLDLTLAISRFSMAYNSLNLAANATAVISDTIHQFKSSLTHLTLSSTTVEYDFGPLLRRIGVLPALRVFELWLILSPRSLSAGGTALTHFLHANKDTLEHLVLKPRPRLEVFVPSVVDTFNDWVRTELAQFVLPNVHTLDLGLRHTRSRPENHTLGEPAMSKLLPKLAPTILPKLRSLSMANVALSLEDIIYVLGDATNGQLDSLKCHVSIFSPQMLDILVSKAPCLTRLSLMYTSLQPYDASQPPPFHGENRVVPTNVHIIIRARRYPPWPLSYLKIGQKAAVCGECHPNEHLSNSLKEAVGRTVLVDLSNVCSCENMPNKILPTSGGGWQDAPRD